MMMKRQRLRRRLPSSMAWLLTCLCLVIKVEGGVVTPRNHVISPISKTNSKSQSASSKLSLSTASSTSSLSSHPASFVVKSSSTSHPPPWMNGIKNSVASSLAAATSKIILAPFDTIKTLQQHVRTSNQASLGLLEAARLITSRPRGIWELYAGLGVAVVGSMPSVGLYFGVYSYCKQRFQQLAASSEWIQQQDPRWVRMTTIALSAAIGNTLASASRVPYEVLKQKLQTNVYRSTTEAIWQMATTGGLRAFFPPGAIAIQTIRDVPYAVVTLLSYEFLRRQTLPSWPKAAAVAGTDATTSSTVSSTPTIPKRHRLEYSDLVWGGLAGGLGSFVTNPFDVIKTRIQTSPEVWGTTTGASTNVLRHCFDMTWQEGGIQAFFRGSVPRLLHKVPANALFFVFYEFFRRALHVQDDVEEYPSTRTGTTTPPPLTRQKTRPLQR